MWSEYKESYYTALTLDVRCMLIVKTNITLPLRSEPTGRTAFFNSDLKYSSCYIEKSFHSVNQGFDSFHWSASSLFNVDLSVARSLGTLPYLCLTFSCRCRSVIWHSRRAFDKESSDTRWTGLGNATERPKISHFASWPFSHSKWGEIKKKKKKKELVRLQLYAKDLG